MLERDSFGIVRLDDIQVVAGEALGLLARASAHGRSGAVDLFEGRGEFILVSGDVSLDHIHMLYIHEGAADGVVIASEADLECELPKLGWVTVVGEYFLNKVFFVVATCDLFGCVFVGDAGNDQITSVHVIRFRVLHHVAELIDVAAVIFDDAEWAAVVGSKLAELSLHGTQISGIAIGAFRDRDSSGGHVEVLDYAVFRGHEPVFHGEFEDLVKVADILRYGSVTGHEADISSVRR